MATILDGIPVRDLIKERLGKEVSALSPKPALAIIQVGTAPDTESYVRQKKNFGRAIGVAVIHEVLDRQMTEAGLISRVEAYNQNAEVAGLIVQLPLPPQINPQSVFDAILPRKDVDGLSSYHLNALFNNEERVLPATARGVALLLSQYNIAVRGKRVAVIGRSPYVGRPIAAVLKNRGGYINVIHRGTEAPCDEMRKADIIVAAAGSPNLVSSECVRIGQTVIDVGINAGTGALEEELPRRHIVGDVDFAAVQKIVSAISPVPGGVGPMTVACLFVNLVEAAGGKKIFPV